MNAFDQFLEEYPLIAFEKGQILLLKDEIPKGVYIIVSGFVKTYTINASGEERLISIDSAGEDIPIGFTAGLITRSQYFYEAYGRCTVRLVPCDAYLKHLVENNASLLRRHIRITKILLASLSRIEALEQSKASDKVALTLLYIADRIGGRFLLDKARFNLSITQQEIANALGLTRETAGIVLKKLEGKKLLAHSRNSYVLYMEKLRVYLSRR
ncbi:MAG: Transcriptional regulatory protein [Candidatus Saccharibacteria bacterium]|nr:Transcriptional regulatory protein [Candidatus Saccharibacteria bacterium]